jgi:hypothetical protein
MARPLELDELVEHFTLYPDETVLLRNKSGATRLGFGLSLKFLLWRARFPRGRGELPDNAIEFVAGQVGVPAADLAFYDWDGRQVRRHRMEIRRATGFRECSVADAEKMTAWLAEHVCCKEQRADRVREELGAGKNGARNPVRSFSKLDAPPPFLAPFLPAPQAGLGRHEPDLGAGRERKWLGKICRDGVGGIAVQKQYLAAPHRGRRPEPVAHEFRRSAIPGRRVLRGTGGAWSLISSGRGATGIRQKRAAGLMTGR